VAVHGPMASWIAALRKDERLRINKLELPAAAPITKVTNQIRPNMFTSVSSRSAAAYQRVSVETAVSQANPHQLVSMLFVALLQNINAARGFMQRGDIASKGEKINKAVRILEEGLKPALDLAQGGDLAANLNGLYGYCSQRLTEANLRNDDAALADVIRVIEPIADGWKQIGGQVAA
jgi:flagellar protein FliS